MDEYSNEFIDYLKRFENFKPNTYWIPGEYWDANKTQKKYTIGYGSTTYADGKKVKKDDTITEEDATNLMHNYLQSKTDSLKQYITNWDKLPQQVKEGLFSIIYRGGSLSKSPKFVQALNNAYEDGQLTTDEYKAILSEMQFNKTGNLQDRMQRNAALLGGMYDYNDNESINTATTKKSPYANFNNNVFYPANKWGKRWVDRQNLYASQANFAQRLKDPNRKSIDLGNGTHGTHLMAYDTINGQNVMYPLIQEELQYPWYDFLKVTTPDTTLVHYDDNKKALNTAIEKGDTIHIQDPWTSEHYKQGFKFKNGGKTNYINFY